MIPLPSGAMVWLATGHTDMRKGIGGLSLLVQEVLGRDPFCGHLFVFRGRRSDLIKIVWHDGQGGYPREHLAAYGGILQADAYAGYNDLYDGRRRPTPVIEAACWSHGRRKLFDLAKLTKAPIAVETVRRIDEIFAIERAINGRPSAERVVVRQAQSKPLIDDLGVFLHEKRALLSAKSDTTKAINYVLNRWTAFTRFLDDGRICLSNNAAERALRGIAIGRRNWTFCGSDAGGQRAAAIYTLIETAKLNDVDPQTWLADVLARLPDHPAKCIDELLPWNWKARRNAPALAQAA